MGDLDTNKDILEEAEEDGILSAAADFLENLPIEFEDDITDKDIQAFRRAKKVVFKTCCLNNYFLLPCVK